jgi:hypothetical protein
MPAGLRQGEQRSRDGAAERAGQRGLRDFMWRLAALRVMNLVVGTGGFACAPAQVAVSLCFGTSIKEIDAHGVAQTARLDAFRCTCRSALSRVQAEPDGEI